MSTRFEWFDNARLGLFIHWGIYAIPAVGEWHMHRDAVPKAEYNKFADEFAPPQSWSPEEWVRLAVRMGAKYAVFTTRHHDGFVLWDSSNNPFNSVRTAAKRDFVREYIDACRKHGIRVGLYYSIRSWQYDGTQSADFNQDSWNRMVKDTHEQLRELMTCYGKIDLLWYDGCSAPGICDSEAMERLWQTRKLNAMVRGYQPDIIINDRSRLPEDFSTPEQCLTPPPAGRRWESCITLNQSWGYTAADHNWKTPETLIRSLLHCARFGGNLLLNIGPEPDGSVPAESVRALEALGDYIRQCPDSIYGAVRTPYTEAVHAAGVVTCANGRYWLHAFHGHALDGAESMREAAPGIYEVELAANAVPANMLGGRHDIVIKAGDSPVLGDNSNHFAPPESSLKIADELLPLLENPRRIVAPEGLYTSLYAADSLILTFPAEGVFDIDIGFVGRTGNGIFGAIPCRVNAPGFPDTFHLHDFHSDGCTLKLKIPEDFAVYALRIQPKWKPFPSTSWQVAGVFPSKYSQTNRAEDAAAALNHDMPAFARSVEFRSVSPHNFDADNGESRVNFSYCFPTENFKIGFGLARRVLVSDCKQTVYACLGNDWWSDVYVNDVRIRPEYTTFPTDPDGPGFIGHKPLPFRLELKEGKNDILVCNHGGTCANWFIFFTNLEE